MWIEQKRKQPQLALWLAPLMLSLSACTTQPARPVTPTISDTLRAACEPLPKLQVQEGTDMRPALLQNAAESDLIHAQCTDRHAQVLRAVGVEPLKAKPVPDRYAEFWKLIERKAP